MAIRACPYCAEEIEDYEKHCPHCSLPVKRLRLHPHSKIVFGLLGAVCLAVALIELIGGLPLNENWPQSTGTPYFTAGSTMEEVLRIEGQPDEEINLEEYLEIANAVSWRYGESAVAFVNGRVFAWTNDDLNLAVREFTLFDTVRAVLQIQGEPDRKGPVSAQNTQTWYYGASKVYFQDGRVADWVNAGNLKVPDLAEAANQKTRRVELP